MPLLHSTTWRQPNVSDQQTYSVAEAAELTGYSKETIRRHIRADKMKAAGGGADRSPYRIARAELARWWRDKGGGELFETPPYFNLAVDQLPKRIGETTGEDCEAGECAASASYRVTLTLDGEEIGGTACHEHIIPVSNDLLAAADSVWRLHNADRRS